MSFLSLLLSVFSSRLAIYSIFSLLLSIPFSLFLPFWQHLFRSILPHSQIVGTRIQSTDNTRPARAIIRHPHVHTATFRNLAKIYHWSLSNSSALHSFAVHPKSTFMNESVRSHINNKKVFISVCLKYLSINCIQLHC